MLAPATLVYTYLGFLTSVRVPSQPVRRLHATPHRAAIFSALNSTADSVEGVPADQASLFASLRARQLSLTAEVNDRWRSAECKSTIPVALDGWIRRLALDWPRAAVGTSDGRVVVTDLTTGETIARKMRAHPAYVETDESARAMRLLHGDYDGGGLTAIAFQGRLVVSAGREGGATLWKLGSPSDGRPEELQEVARLGTDDAVVSAIQLTGDLDGVDEGNVGIWLACLDGVVRKWEYSSSWSFVAGESPPAGSAPRCTLRLRCESAVLDFATLEVRGLCACATAVGSVQVFSMEQGVLCGQWEPLVGLFERQPGSGGAVSKGERARTLAFVPVEQGSNGHTHALLVGGSDGSMHARYLAAARGPQDERGEQGRSAEGGDSDAISADGLWDEASEPVALLPAHGGACVALTPVGDEAPGLVVSGAHDGTLRMWDLEWSPEKGLPSDGGGVGAGGDGAVCLYGLGGYKVWLGSVVTDGKRLVSDGRDNCVLVHDFTLAPEARRRPDSE